MLINALEAASSSSDNNNYRVGVGLPDPFSIKDLSEYSILVEIGGEVEKKKKKKRKLK